MENCRINEQINNLEGWFRVQGERVRPLRWMLPSAGWKHMFASPVCQKISQILLWKLSQRKVPSTRQRMWVNRQRTQIKTSDFPTVLRHRIGPTRQSHSSSWPPSSSLLSSPSGSPKLSLHNPTDVEERIKLNDHFLIHSVEDPVVLIQKSQGAQVER